MCMSCVQNATIVLQRMCPYNNRQALFWDSYYRLRYSDEPTFRTLDTNHYNTSFQIEGNVTSPNEFRADLMRFVVELGDNASNGGDSRKVAAGNTSTSDSQIIYALVQCTPDLDPVSCMTCLSAAASGRLPIAEEAMSLMPSCNIQYSIRPFVNQTWVSELEQQSPAVPRQQSPTMTLQESQPDVELYRPVGVPTSNMTRIIIIVIVSVAAGLLIIGLFVGFFIRNRRNQTPTEETNSVAQAHPSTLFDNGNVESFQLDFGKLREATDDLSEDKKLGRGGFGFVYKGKLDGRDIAVKRLSVDTSHQGEQEFRAEVNVLGKLDHTNLVKLIGFSSQGREKLLVYEYIPNKSLDKFLFESTKRLELDWGTRYKIIEGIVKGIVYLHKERIILRDLKPHNVLLDENMNSKMADFGLASLIDTDVTHVTASKAIGTGRYMAPEYEDKRQCSLESDVFSFGVLLLEIISGQKHERFRNTRHNLIISRAWDDWCKGAYASLVDHTMLMDSSVPGDILKCIHIGLLCVQHHKAVRPSINSVFTMLNSPPSSTFSIPPQPGFYASTDSTREEEETPNNFVREGEGLSLLRAHRREGNPKQIGYE